MNVPTFGICIFIAFGGFFVLEIIDAQSSPQVTVKVAGNDSSCLDCICQAISNCSNLETCDGDTCGPYRITWAYWADGGKHVVGNDNSSSPTAYPNCTRDFKCSRITVQSYIERFAQDCNADGVVDCYDYAAIHKLGGYGCANTQLSGDYLYRLKQCLQSEKPSSGYSNA